jgi:hypothetical protein
VPSPFPPPISLLLHPFSNPFEGELAQALEIVLVVLVHARRARHAWIQPPLFEEQLWFMLILTVLLVLILKVWGMGRRIILVVVVLFIPAMLSLLSSSKTVTKVRGSTQIALLYHVLHSYTVIGFMMQWPLV